ncbi:MAG TPA: peptidoglycan-associated lipoprotein Pal [Methylibium sp.]|nr:peptidoglycan-associated lipoprotein Pal [Methylibium sp.]
MNTIKHRIAPLAALVTAFVLAGCASSVKLDDPPVESRTPGGTAGNGAGSAGASQSGVAPVDLTGKTDSALLAKVVYFDFDSFVVKDEYRSIVEGHARLLSGNRAKRVVVEGHADERGGREYNLALGQKRAEAVSRAMVLLGAQDAQVESVSYGEERPAATGSDETAWAKNRRAELRDR